MSAARSLAPAERLREIAGRAYPFLLESSLRTDALGRYSFLGADPFLLFRSRAEAITIDTAEGTRRLRGDPFEAVAALLREYALPEAPGTAPFRGGAVGYFAYDLNRLLERRIPDAARDEHGMPDIHLGFYDRVEVWDHQTGEAFVAGAGSPRPPVRRAAHPRAPGPPRAEMEGLRSTFTRDAYIAAVIEVKRRIREGEIYQANLSQRFRAGTDLHPVLLYERLGRMSPAPFSAYLDGGEFQVLSSSPERFLQVRGRGVETRPIKGTRPRGGTPAEDERLATDLMESEKDAAELAMIVDVERNDLGRVSEYGTVRVERARALRTLPTVFHLEATVTSRMRPETGLADLLRATFPGGSITGAPKIRAMEIIEEIEPTRRGVYTGAIGYLGFDGSCDLNVAIRTIVLDRGVATFQVGGGIVWDSEPEAEYQETLDKARGILLALDRG